MICLVGFDKVDVLELGRRTILGLFVNMKNGFRRCSMCDAECLPKDEIRLMVSVTLGRWSV